MFVVSKEFAYSVYSVYFSVAFTNTNNTNKTSAASLKLNDSDSVII